MEVTVTFFISFRFSFFPRSAARPLCAAVATVCNMLYIFHFVHHFELRSEQRESAMMCECCVLLCCVHERVHESVFVCIVCAKAVCLKAH